MVPTLAENCLRQSLHFQILRDSRNVTLLELQCTHSTPSGQRSETKYLRAYSLLENLETASSKFAGAFMFQMIH